MKTRTFLSLCFPLVLGGAAHAQNADSPSPAAIATSISQPFFRDVPPNHWAFAAVQRLAGAGIVQGFPKNDAPQKIAGSTAPKPGVAVVKRMALKPMNARTPQKAPRVADTRNAPSSKRIAR